MTITNEQLGARVDRVEGRLASVETQVSLVKQDMATKGDIQRVLDAVSSLDAKTAGPVEVFSTAKSVGRFTVWGGTIIAAIFGAIVAVKEWVLR